MKTYLILICCLLMSVSFRYSTVLADSILKEGVREFEELRLRQLQTVQSKGGMVPFTTDGCSGYLSHSWERFAENWPLFREHLGEKPPWEHCCLVHDKVYWSGRAVDGFAKRKQADEELRQCVIRTGDGLAPGLSKQYSKSEKQIREAFSVTADIMYRAVRLGGLPCSLLPWRWGYGWPSCAFANLSDIPKSYSNLKSDEQITFFNTSAWQSKDGQKWFLPIHAWVYEPADSSVRIKVFADFLESKYDLKAEGKAEKIFKDRFNLIVADSERGKRLVIRIAGQDVILPLSKPNGHVKTTIELSAEEVNAFALNGYINYFAVLQPEDERRYQGRVRLIPRHGINIISDIDDTVKITNVTNRKELLENTFFREFRAVKGMPELYQRFNSKGAAIFFVSSSPWQLYEPLDEFLKQAGFPRATMSLKNVRFVDETLFNLFKKGTETKPAQLEPILQRYPARQFVLIGDNGEEDPEVYGEIAREYPTQVKQILIRNIDKSLAEDKRYRKAFKNVPREKWQLFEIPMEI